MLLAPAHVSDFDAPSLSSTTDTSISLAETSSIKGHARPIRQRDTSISLAETSSITGHAMPIRHLTPPPIDSGDYEPAFPTAAQDANVEIRESSSSGAPVARRTGKLFPVFGSRYDASRYDASRYDASIITIIITTKTTTNSFLTIIFRGMCQEWWSVRINR